MFWKEWPTSSLLLAAVLALCAPLPACAHGNDAGSGLAGYGAGGDFTLASPDGPLSLSDLRGKVVAIFFGYTSCPDVCPLSLARLNACFTAMTDEEREQVRALFITLDPERDTSERLEKYMSYFHPNMIGLRGDVNKINAVTRKYGIEYSKKNMPDSALGYSISHPTDILLIDREGRLVSAVPHNTPVSRLLAHIRGLLNAAD